jgi:hypothetical protein
VGSSAVRGHVKRQDGESPADRLIAVISKLRKVAAIMPIGRLETVKKKEL